MNTAMLSSALGGDAVAEAIALLGDLGAEIVDRCRTRCEICGPVLDAAA